MFLATLFVKARANACLSYLLIKCDIYCRIYMVLSYKVAVYKLAHRLRKLCACVMLAKNVATRESVGVNKLAGSRQCGSPGHH